MYFVSKSTTVVDYSVAAVNFCKLRSNVSFKDTLLGLACKLSTQSPVQGFDSNIDLLSGYVNNYTALKDTPIFKKIYRFLMYCIGLSLCEKMGVSFDLPSFMQVEEGAMKKQFNNRADFVHCILDTILFILK
jgi:hypothetical protein